MSAFKSRKWRFALPLAIGSLLALTVAGAAMATHPRPIGAAQIRVVFVPAFAECTAAAGIPAGNTHGAPLGFPSCSPPGPDTRVGGTGAPHGHAHVTIPSEDSSKARGSAFISVQCAPPSEIPPCDPTPGENQDVILLGSASDVRCTTEGANAATHPAYNASGSGDLCPASGNGGAGNSTLEDYVGKLLSVAVIRITDHYNTAPTFTTAGTVDDRDFPVGSGCGPTVATDRGGFCSISTSANAIVPTVVKENKRANVEIAQIQTFEPGHNAAFTAGTIVPVPTPVCPPVCNKDGDDQIFANQGIFIP